QTAMRELDGARDDREQPEPLGDAEAHPLAVDVDRQSVDIFHDEKRAPISGHAAVEQAGDVRMVERREDLTFGEEPLHQLWVGAVAENLDRSAAAELAVIALRIVDDAHPAATDLTEQAV